MTHTNKPQMDVEVSPGVYQSQEDYEANMAYDEARDEELLDELSSK